MKEIRVLLADHHALIRGGIRALLERIPELQIVAEASDGPEALRLIEQHQCDAALKEALHGSKARLAGSSIRR